MMIFDCLLYIRDYSAPVRVDDNPSPLRQSIYEYIRVIVSTSPRWNGGI